MFGNAFLNCYCIRQCFLMNGDTVIPTFFNLLFFNYFLFHYFYLKMVIVNLLSSNWIIIFKVKYRIPIAALQQYWLIIRTESIWMIYWNSYVTQELFSVIIISFLLCVIFLEENPDFIGGTVYGKGFTKFAKYRPLFFIYR